MAAHENEESLHAGEAQADEWQDGQPPDDDFHDDQSAASSMSADEGEASADAFQTAPPPKKSGAGVMLGTLALGVVVVGGLAYMQFGDMLGGQPVPQGVPAVVLDTASAPVSAGVPSAPPATPDIPQPDVKTVDLPSTPTTSEADLSSIYKGAHAPERTTGDMAAVPAPGTPMAASAPVVPAAPAQPMTAPDSLPSAVSQQPAAQGAAFMDARLNALEAQIDDLRKVMDQTNQRASQLADRLEAVSVKSALPDALPVVENRLDQIERQIANLKTASPAPSARPSAFSGVKKAVPVRPAKKTKVSAKKIAVASPASEKETWVLRAATPGEAWVAKDANAAQLRKVKVGDILPGIGEVKSIGQAGGGWAVEGTQGVIR
jgi:hypothetical protein